MALELQITSATVEFYGIVCLAAGGYTDHKTVAGYLAVTDTFFSIIKAEILSNDDNKLPTKC